MSNPHYIPSHAHEQDFGISVVVGGGGGGIILVGVPLHVLSPGVGLGGGAIRVVIVGGLGNKKQKKWKAKFISDYNYLEHF